MGAHARVTLLLGGEASVSESLLEPLLPTPTSHSIRLFHPGPGDSQTLPSEGLVLALLPTHVDALQNHFSCAELLLTASQERGGRPSLDGSAVLPVPQLRASPPWATLPAERYYPSQSVVWVSVLSEKCPVIDDGSHKPSLTVSG